MPIHVSPELYDAANELLLRLPAGYVCYKAYGNQNRSGEPNPMDLSAKKT